MVAFAEDTTTGKRRSCIRRNQSAVSQVTANINAVIPIALGVLGTCHGCKAWYSCFQVSCKYFSKVILLLSNFCSVSLIGGCGWRSPFFVKRIDIYDLFI